MGVGLVGRTATHGAMAVPFECRAACLSRHGIDGHVHADWLCCCTGGCCAVGWHGLLDPVVATWVLHMPCYRCTKPAMLQLANQERRTVVRLVLDVGLSRTSRWMGSRAHAWVVDPGWGWACVKLTLSSVGRV